MKPQIVVTHECPESVSKSLFPNHDMRRSATGNALDTMFQLHKPRLWVFGHWHTNIRRVILGTMFVCVANNDAVDIDISFASS
jgi:hypothetical protein